MSKSYIVILQYLWCNETGGGIEYIRTASNSISAIRLSGTDLSCVKATISTSELSRPEN